MNVKDKQYVYISISVCACVIGFVTVPIVMYFVITPTSQQVFCPFNATCFVRNFVTMTSQTQNTSFPVLVTSSEKDMTSQECVVARVEFWLPHRVATTFALVSAYNASTDSLEIHLDVFKRKHAPVKPFSVKLCHAVFPCKLCIPIVLGLYFAQSTLY